jgi:hypothetical protein
MTLLWMRPNPTTKEEPVKGDRSNDNTTTRETAVTVICHRPTEEKLQSVQADLEQERAKRRELEAQIAHLTTTARQKQQLAKTVTSKKKANAPPSHFQMVALQTEVQGYQQIVNALTAGRPAIDFAIAQELRRSKTEEASSTSMAMSSSSILVNPHQAIPLHTIRLLEFMPWHPQAREAAIVKEEVWEWQVYDEKNSWRSELSYFPTFFKALPVIAQPTATSNNINHKAVWTNESLTLRLVDPCDGRRSVLPQMWDSPTWKWIGEWQVQTVTDDNMVAMYRDQDGWSYATEASHFLLAETSQLPSHYLMEPTCLPPQVVALTKDSHANHTRAKPSPRTLIRRRQWSRSRVLVDYPHACEASVHFLALLAQTQELLLTNSHLQTCYQQTQQSLADAHRQLVKQHEAHEQCIKSLEQEHLHQIELLERQRGPPPRQFVPSNVVLEDDHRDDDNDDATKYSLSDQLIKMDRSLLLNPEDGTMDRRTDHAKGSAFFGLWGNNSHNKADHRTITSPAPDVEPCSDCNSVTSCEEHEISESDDACLPQFSSPSEERHKSFLQLWFIGKHPEGSDNKAVITAHKDVQTF